jgi:hypothetical protein
VSIITVVSKNSPRCLRLVTVWRLRPRSCFLRPVNLAPMAIGVFSHSGSLPLPGSDSVGELEHDPEPFGFRNSFSCGPVSSLCLNECDSQRRMQSRSILGLEAKEERKCTRTTYNIYTIHIIYIVYIICIIYIIYTQNRSLSLTLYSIPINLHHQKRRNIHSQVIGP